MTDLIAAGLNVTPRFLALIQYRVQNFLAGQRPCFAIEVHPVLSIEDGTDLRERFSHVVMSQRGH